MKPELKFNGTKFALALIMVIFWTPLTIVSFVGHHTDVALAFLFGSCVAMIAFGVEMDHLIADLNTMKKELVQLKEKANGSP